MTKKGNINIVCLKGYWYDVTVDKVGITWHREGSSGSSVAKFLGLSNKIIISGMGA